MITMTPELEAAWLAEFEVLFGKEPTSTFDAFAYTGWNIKRQGYLAAKRADHAEIARLREALGELYEAVSDLMAQSHGVGGLHTNGAIATWDELETGGLFEEWIGVAMDKARAALAEPPAEAKENDE